MTKKYKLLKDLPNVKSGVIFNPVSALAYATIGVGKWHIEYCNEIIENNPEWFQEVLPVSEPVKDRIEVKDISFQQEDNSGYFYYVVKTSGYINHTQGIPLMKSAIESALNDTVVEDNAFVWTDELVKEFHEFYKAYPNNMYLRINKVLQDFKQSKQSSPMPTNKEWEIVSLHHKNDSINKLILSDKKDCYYWSGGELNKNPINIDYVLSTNDFIIHSVRRFSDMEVFSVGDKIDHRESEDCKWNNSPSKIMNFAIRDKMMIVEFMEDDETSPYPVGSVCRELCDVKKIPAPIPTTPTQPIVEDEKKKEFKDGYWVHKDFLSKMNEITGVKYTQEQMDKAIEDAFSAAREIHPIMGDGANLFAQRVRMAALFSTLQDYINHLKQNK